MTRSNKPSEAAKVNLARVKKVKSPKKPSSPNKSKKKKTGLTKEEALTALASLNLLFDTILHAKQLGEFVFGAVGIIKHLIFFRCEEEIQRCYRTKKSESSQQVVQLFLKLAKLIAMQDLIAQFISSHEEEVREGSQHIDDLTSRVASILFDNLDEPTEAIEAAYRSWRLHLMALALSATPIGKRARV